MAKASSPPPNPTQRRLNVRRLIILAAVIVALVPAYFVFTAFFNGRTRDSALAQAKASEAAGNVDLALKNMERFVAGWPNDLEGLRYQSKLLAETADDSKLMTAAQANDRVLRLDPDSPESQDVRRRLIRLYVRYSDMARRRALERKDSGELGADLRYRAAEAVARQLIAQGADDAEAHLLLAMSLQGSAVTDGKIQDPKALDQAIAEFGLAVAKDPKNIPAAVNLARLQWSQKKDPAAALRVLDAMAKAQPDSAEARLARYGFFVEVKDGEKARAEIEAAAKQAPKDPLVQATAASDAIQRRDFAAARRAIDAIPADEANRLRIQTLRGSLDIAEQHPDAAIEEWRKGLVAAEGTDLSLTWQLANSLIQLGRLTEAQPLVAQFQRLAGENGDAYARYLRAMLDLRSGRPRVAIKELNRLVDRVGPAMSPEVYLALGQAHEALNEESQALVAYRRMVALRPAAPEPRRAISRILAIKSPGDAITEMERALGQNPDDPNLLVEVGRLRFRQQMALPASKRRWEGVTEILDRAAKVDPNNFPAQILRADLLAATDRLGEAVEPFRLAVEGPSKNKVEAWLAYIAALEKMNRRDEALRQIDRATLPENVGDHALLRIARARNLVRLNQAQAARDALALNREKVPVSERPELVHALADLCRELGDLAGARAALAEWAKLQPSSADPGLNLISFAQSHDDDEAARLGLEALRAIGGDEQPYSLAARALELLRIDQVRSNSTELTVATDPAELKRLAEADKCVSELAVMAPQLPIVPTLQGLVLERRGNLPEAIEAYRRAVKDATVSPALPRLVELLSRQQRYDELEQLKAKYEAKATTDGTPSLVTTFDQISAAVAVKLGDDRRAEQAVAEMIKEQPDNLAIRLSQAGLLTKLGRFKEAEATLRQLAGRLPADPTPWAALVEYRVQHPDLGPIDKLIDEARAGYKGPHPELLVARLRWQAKDIPAAIKLFEAAVAQNPSDLEVLRAAVEFDDANGRAQEAEAKLRRALKLDPKATWAGRTLALLLSNGADPAAWQEAWSLVKPGSPSAGEAPEDRLARATVQARSPDREFRDQAAPALASLARDLPASNLIAIEARIRLAQSMLATNQHAAAAAMIAPVADDADRPNATALAIAVEALTRSNDAPAAKKRYDRLEAIEPKSPRTAASRAWILRGQGKPAEATALIESSYAEAEAANSEVVALAFQDLMSKLDLPAPAAQLAARVAAKWPRDAYVLAKAQLAEGKVAEALKSCQIAMKAGGIAETINVAIQVAVLKQNDPAVLQQVDELASTALAQAPKSLPVTIFAATLRHLQGRFEDEIALYRQALENDPPRFSFLNNMAWTLCEGLQRYPEALERIDEAIRREGRDPQFLDTRGVILVRLNRPEEAVADLEESIKIAQLAGQAPSATTYFHLARTYRQLNKQDDYRRCRDMVRKLKLDVGSLDPPDKADYAGVMGQ